MTNTSHIAIQFLIPVTDNDGNPYPGSVFEDLEHELVQRFGGWSLVSGTPMPGAWVDDAGLIVEDNSCRYEVAIDATRLPELDAYLAEVAKTTKQDAIYRVIVGQVAFISPAP